MGKGNEYALLNFKENEEGGQKSVQMLTFYEMNPDGTWENGTTVENVLDALIGRLVDLNGRFACRENSLAITKLEEALMWLNKRTENRIARGVEGKHLA